MKFRLRFNDGTIVDSAEQQIPITGAENYANLLNSLVTYKNHDNAFIQIGNERRKYADLFSVEIILEKEINKSTLS